MFEFRPESNPLKFTFICGKQVRQFYGSSTSPECKPKEFLTFFFWAAWEAYGLKREEQLFSSVQFSIDRAWHEAVFTTKSTPLNTDLTKPLQAAKY